MKQRHQLNQVETRLSESGPGRSRRDWCTPRFVTRLLSRFRGSRDGAAAVEFAILLPIFVLMVGAILQFAAAMFVQNQMVNVARETARSLAIGDLTEAQAVTKALSELSNFGSGYVVTATNIPANSDVTVAIRVPLNKATIVNIVDILDSYDLTASVSIRK